MELLDVEASYYDCSSMDNCDVCCVHPLSMPLPSSTTFHHNSAVEQQQFAAIDCMAGEASAEQVQQELLPVYDPPITMVFDHPLRRSSVQIGHETLYPGEKTFSSNCSQLASSSCNWWPYSAEHPSQQAVPLTSNARRPNWTCPECRRRFDNFEQFHAHFEPCWVNAVEREHRQQKQLMERHVISPFEDGSKPMIQPYHVAAVGEELHFDGEPALLRSKSGAISLFVALESEVNAKANSFVGKSKQTAAANCGRIGHNQNSKEATESVSADEANCALSEKVECPVCGKCLFRHNLQVHYRIHTGELPFPCAFCLKRFRTSSARRVHHRSHTGEKPYPCTFCEYACTTKRNLERHVHNRHMPIRAIAQQRQRKNNGTFIRRGGTTIKVESIAKEGVAMHSDDASEAEVDDSDDDYAYQ
ncbi:hypothetical protein GPALN_006179 [Globodera pallida]|nr:hypothetical protein GPALN_006179 [Globodera pallida]